MRTVKRDEKRYYEELVEFSKKNLMIFPYHLSDVVIKGLRYRAISRHCCVVIGFSIDLSDDLEY